MYLIRYRIHYVATRLLKIYKVLQASLAVFPGCDRNEIFTRKEVTGYRPQRWDGLSGFNSKTGNKQEKDPSDTMMFPINYTEPQLCVTLRRPSR